MFKGVKQVITFISKDNRKKYKNNRWKSQIKNLYSNNNNDTYYDLSKLSFQNIYVQIIYVMIMI